MTRSADSPVLLLLACFQLLLTGVLWVAWHLGLLTVPAALGADAWLLHEVTLAAVPLLVAARGGVVPAGIGWSAAIIAAWGMGRLAITFLPEPPLWLALTSATALPALLAGLAGRRFVGLLLLALAVAAGLLQWEAWRYGTASSAWLAVALGAALLPAASGGRWRPGVVVFLALGLMLLAAGWATANPALDRAALVSLTLAPAAQALPVGRPLLALSGAAALLMMLGLALPWWPALLAGAVVWGVVGVVGLCR